MCNLLVRHKVKIVKAIKSDHPRSYRFILVLVENNYENISQIAIEALKSNFYRTVSNALKVIEKLKLTEAIPFIEEYINAHTNSEDIERAKIIIKNLQ